jgi:hypothetical protein
MIRSAPSSSIVSRAVQCLHTTEHGLQLRYRGSAAGLLVYARQRDRRPVRFGRLGYSDNGLDLEPLVDSVDDFQLHRLIVLMSTAFRGVSRWFITGTRVGSLVIVPPRVRKPRLACGKG